MGGIVLMKVTTYNLEIILLTLNAKNDAKPPYIDIEPPDFHHFSLVYFDFIIPNINRANNTDI